MCHVSEGVQQRRPGDLRFAAFYRKVGLPRAPFSVFTYSRPVSSFGAPPKRSVASNEADIPTSLFAYILVTA